MGSEGRPPSRETLLCLLRGYGPQARYPASKVLFTSGDRSTEGCFSTRSALPVTVACIEGKCASSTHQSGSVASATEPDWGRHRRHRTGKDQRLVRR